MRTRRDDADRCEGFFPGDCLAHCQVLVLTCFAPEVLREHRLDVLGVGLADFHLESVDVLGLREGAGEVDAAHAVAAEPVVLFYGFSGHGASCRGVASVVRFLVALVLRSFLWILLLGVCVVILGFV